MGQIQSIEELISLLLRRRWLIIVVTVIGMVLSVLVAKAKVDTYEAFSVIQVEVPTVSSSGGDGTTPQSSAAVQMLQAIEQRLTTRESLTAMIERHGLFADTPELPLDKQIFALRQAVTFQTVDSEAGQNFGQARAISAIIISARWGTADLSARIANDFAQGILDQTSAGQLDRASENVRFFKDEEARLWTELTSLEAEMADYKNKNADSLPDLRSARQDELVNFDADLRRLGEDYLGLKGQRDQLDANPNKRETDRRQIADLDAQMQILDGQIASLTEKRLAVEASLSTTPEVERVLNNYDRRLTQLQGQHELVTQRMAEAETNARLASLQKSERFTLLERAITPEYPTGGGRKKIAMAGSVASLAAALALAFILDLLKPVVRTSAQMERQLSLRPVVSIPEIREAKDGVSAKLVPYLENPKRKSLFGLPGWIVLTAGCLIALLVVAALLA